MSNGTLGPTNPLTTAIIVLPMVWLPDSVAASLFFGISSALLAFSLTRNGKWWRLITFLRAPYIYALVVVQWSPLLVAVALFPILLPLTLAKPHIGITVALTHLTWRRLLLCCVLVVISLIVDFSWPFRWLQQVSSYDGHIPLFVLPGPLILLALTRWRD